MAHHGPVVQVHSTKNGGRLWGCSFEPFGTVNPVIIFIPKAGARRLCNRDTIYSIVTRKKLGDHGLAVVEWAGFSNPTVETFEENMGNKEFRAILLNTLQDFANRSKTDDAFYMAERSHVRMMLSKFHALTTSELSKKRIDVVLRNYLPK